MSDMQTQARFHFVSSRLRLHVYRINKVHLVLQAVLMYFALFCTHSLIENINKKSLVKCGLLPIMTKVKK